MAKTYRQAIGSWGEDLALKWLIDKDYELIQRNFRHQNDEIDLVMRKDKVIVFFEVKTRRSDSYGLAEFSITPKKLSALFRCINHYLVEQKLEDMEWQLDLLVVEKFNKDEDAEILHFERLGEYED